MLTVRVENCCKLKHICRVVLGGFQESWSEWIELQTRSGSKLMVFPRYKTKSPCGCKSRDMAFHKSFQPLLLVVLIFFPFCTPLDTITPIKSVRDGETLVSAGEKFVLGFFSPDNSKNRYVGIWYNKIPDQTIVWTANRENPVKNSSGALIIKGGNLVLVDGGHSNNSTLWSTNVSTTAYYSSATLSDSGNLVLTDDHQMVLWESFDYPTNTWLPQMKLGLNRRTGLNRILTSWKSVDNPEPGEFSVGLDPVGVPQYFLRMGSHPIMRHGPWNGLRLNGMPQMNVITLELAYSYVANDDEIYLMYSVNNTSITTRFVLDDSGVSQRFLWNDNNQRWKPMEVANRERCDLYGNCGAYGSCDLNRVVECECLKGFEPKTPSEWNLRDWSGGCKRKRSLDCDGKGDGFLILEHAKLPDTSRSRVEPGLNLEACKEECLKYCNCTAYASADISQGDHGCLMWDGELVDLRVYSYGGQDLYIRVAASELDGGLQGKKKLLVTLLTIIVGLLLFISCGYCWWRKAKGREMNGRHDTVLNDNDIEENGKGSELLLFNVNVIAAATNNFSETNLLGKGGFGPVYKGQLLNGQEIAVKRLSKTSTQGIKEFKNEVTLIAKLQHRNLVRLLGYGISGQEKILIYEYMRNKSLDSIIFDQKRSAILDWRKRFSIIVGIARGILYLHEDSRFRIIHRDLKVSNILLDDDLDPKISDFGMARIFGQNQAQANTNRVVGTYGYMSPEYAMDGRFSVKSDAFSFGVILLEIITGKKNNYYCDCCSKNLIGHVWEKWKEDRAMEVVDSSMINISSFTTEVLRSAMEIARIAALEYGTTRFQASFDYPTNTHLSRMKIGLNLRIGLQWILTSWKSVDDAALGEYSFGIDLTGVPQFILRKGSDPIWQSGPWNGQRFSNVPLMTSKGTDSSITSIFVLDHSGLLQWLTWNHKNRRWNVIFLATHDRCDGYATCGAHASCDSIRVAWPLDCDGKGDGFFILEHVKLPDTSRSRLEPGLRLEACQEECLKNCKCTAYASADISEGGRGCLMWGGDLIDLQIYSEGGQDIYTRVAASELAYIISVSDIRSLSSCHFAASLARDKGFEKREGLQEREVPPKSSSSESELNVLRVQSRSSCIRKSSLLILFISVLWQWLETPEVTAEFNAKYGIPDDVLIRLNDPNNAFDGYSFVDGWMPFYQVSIVEEVYELSKSGSDNLYYLLVKAKPECFVNNMEDSNKYAGDDHLFVSGHWEYAGTVPEVHYLERVATEMRTSKLQAVARINDASKSTRKYLWLATLIFFPICNSTDTLTPIQSLRDGDTLISADQIFVLGFFSPGNSKNRYVGIWYNKIPNQTVVWTANRQNPVRDSSGILTINGGNLVLVDGGHNINRTLWSTNVSSSAMGNYSSATLTDSGNLVLTDGHGVILWESFDYPTNTLLPGMKLGLSLRTGLSWFLTSWKSVDDPAPGEFTLSLDLLGMPQYFLRMGLNPIWRTAPWSGQGVPTINSASVYSWSYVANHDEIYVTYNGNNTTITSRFVLDDSGSFRKLMWSNKNRRWDLMWLAAQDRCDRYANCGAYGFCDSNRVAECECLRGFEPKTPSDWNSRDWSGGCVRKRSLDCDGNGDGFLRLENVKVPDTTKSRVEPGLSLEACKEECLKNCSCTAYASFNLSGDGRCLMWDGDLFDLRVKSDGGHDIYIRVAASELADSWFSQEIRAPVAVVNMTCKMGFTDQREKEGLKEMVAPAATGDEQGEGKRHGGGEGEGGAVADDEQGEGLVTVCRRDGETLISAGKKFVLGFFSPDNSSTNRYVGIWYDTIPVQTIVWTANRENPVKNSSGVLIIKGGNLVLVDGGHSNNSTLWSTNVSTAANYSSAALTDLGNLVLTDDQERTLWESFDYPTNTWLPRMKLGLDRRTRLSRFLTSWKSTTDPAPGEFSFVVDPTGVPQYFIRLGSDRIWRSGPWNGRRLSGVPIMNLKKSYSWSYVANDDEIFLTYNSNNSLTNFVLDNSGLFRRRVWNDKKRNWNLMLESTQDRCDRYANCKAYGSCNPNLVDECECLRGFEPKTPSEWNSRYWSGGCVRRRSLDCDGKGDGFLRLANVKLPDTSRSRVEPGLNLDACKDECLKNCNCTTYASADISQGGHGCLVWDGELVDLTVYSDGGQDIYTRVAASELNGSAIEYSRGSQGKKKLLVPLLTTISGLLLFFLCGYCWWRKAKGWEKNERLDNVWNNNDIEENGKGSELLLFNVSVITAATNNFSESNLLGKGGFGPVYKGRSLMHKLLQEQAFKPSSKAAPSLSFTRSLTTPSDPPVPPPSSAPLPPSDLPLPSAATATSLSIQWDTSQLQLLQKHLDSLLRTSIGQPHGLGPSSKPHSEKSCASLFSECLSAGHIKVRSPYVDQQKSQVRVVTATTLPSPLLLSPQLLLQRSPTMKPEQKQLAIATSSTEIEAVTASGKLPPLLPLPPSYTHHPTPTDPSGSHVVIRPILITNLSAGPESPSNQLPHSRNSR
ncbi:Protein kinase domain-containing protein [Cinnamomum micranthum f. kanehirae]|uniref:non-specific serine/threonine protein kinase n=1 Tax=Cinnamomum micranthum f. kanehirae TaxID=337451 RepID=A0A3S3NWW4_9MAGN|nr:Protein kinase domain-containing protein [Cinnamomum micranthum f. kanehirae]